jgi:hypothetical protein
VATVFQTEDLALEDIERKHKNYLLKYLKIESSHPEILRAELGLTIAY